MTMKKMKTVQGETKVYDSKEAEGFKQVSEYPIAWEFMYINDAAGKRFTNQLLTAINQLPKELGQLLELHFEASDVARCTECVFASKDAFRKVLNESLKGITIYDEKQESTKTKVQLLDDAGKIIAKELAVA